MLNTFVINHWNIIGFGVQVVDNLFNVGNAFDLFLENKRWMVPVLLGHTSSEFYSVPNVRTLDEFEVWLLICLVIMPMSILRFAMPSREI